jgi:glyoxylase-like metal-dependent hydrolase (beta-lactamase superfamily II)
MNIHAIQTGVVRVKSDFIRGSIRAGGIFPFLHKLFTDKVQVDIPIYAWVIEHSEGVIVVDTGDNADSGTSFITRSEFFVPRDEEIGPQLAKLGIGIEDVSKVVLTHLHPDHVNGLKYFARTPIFVSQEEIEARKPLIGGFLNRMATPLPAWFAPTPIVFAGEPCGPFERSYPLTKAGDVFAVPTPGHTRGHLSVIAMKDGVSYFLAGDVTYTEQALLAQEPQGPSDAPQFHLQTQERVLRYTQENLTVYLPSHDPEGVQRLERRQTCPHNPR